MHKLLTVNRLKINDKKHNNLNKELNLQLDASLASPMQYIARLGLLSKEWLKDNSPNVKIKTSDLNKTFGSLALGQEKAIGGRNKKQPIPPELISAALHNKLDIAQTVNIINIINDQITYLNKTNNLLTRSKITNNKIEVLQDLKKLLCDPPGNCKTVGQVIDFWKSSTFFTNKRTNQNMSKGRVFFQDRGYLTFTVFNNKSENFIKKLENNFGKNTLLLQKESTNEPSKSATHAYKGKVNGLREERKNKDEKITDGLRAS